MSVHVSYVPFGTCMYTSHSSCMYLLFFFGSHISFLCCIDVVLSARAQPESDGSFCSLNPLDLDPAANEVCVCVCVYVCMYVCSQRGSNYVSVYVCMCMYECMYVCMYVYM